MAMALVIFLFYVKRSLELRTRERHAHIRPVKLSMTASHLTCKGVGR